jgi:cardiolipin synthase
MLYDINWKKIIFRRRTIVVAAVFLQIVVLLFVSISGSYYRNLYSVLYGLGLIFSIRILSRREKPVAYKITWIFFILLSPVFGGLLYLTLYFQTNYRNYRKILEGEVQNRQHESIHHHAYKNIIGEISDNGAHAQAVYLQKFAGFPCYKNTLCKYFAGGESYFATLFEVLLLAEKYIFIEYFIINPGFVLDRLLTILEAKAKKGVEVRIMYDDVGCFMSVPNNFTQELKNRGIKCIVFNRVSPALSTLQNNRDHRKIVSIDGKIAFTGGINIGDEYINAYEKYGRWKDSGIMLQGEASWGLTLIFLTMWNVENTRNKFAHDNYGDYYPYKTEKSPVVHNSFVLPFSDNPIDDDNVGEAAYLLMINNAREYIFINTPYLIPDDSIIQSLILAANSGVDVRIITPHRPDKKLVHMVTRSYYRTLIKAGVRIYEYTIGFNHSKAFVSDDKVAIIGTMNLDFRSLYLHYECGVWICNDGEIARVREDFLETLALCKEVTLEEAEGKLLSRSAQDVLRIVAPLL